MAGLNFWDHPQTSVGRKKYLGENGFKSKNKEKDVAYASKLISESFDFGIETLGRSICRAVSKVIGNSSIVVLHRLNHRVEKLAIQPFHFVVPPSEFCQSYCLIALCVEYLGQFH